MTSRGPVLCRACIRFKARQGTCSAFSRGIPVSIMVFGGDHRTSVEGDNGVVFELGESPEQEKAFTDWKALNEAMES